MGGFAIGVSSEDGSIGHSLMGLPRHRQGSSMRRKVWDACNQEGIPNLTLFGKDMQEQWLWLFNMRGLNASRGSLRHYFK
jgi:hypothetical protein